MKGQGFASSNRPSGDKLFEDVGDVSTIANEIDSGKVQDKLKDIQDTGLRELLVNLLELDPTNRWTVDCALQSSFFRDDARTTTHISRAFPGRNSD